LGSRKRRSAVAIIAATVAALGLASLGGAAVPGQNGRIAFDRYSNGSFFADIFTIRPDGSDLIKLTRRSPEDDDRLPAYSPNGKRIAWSRDDDIWLMNSDGSGKLRLTRTGVDYDVAFSPTGRKLIWTHVVGQHSYLKVMKLDGSGARRVGVEGLNPAYSPDGQWIAYDRDNGPEDDIYTAYRNGESELNITASQSSDARHPDWSPDGQTIVYQRYPSGGGSFDIYTMDPGGGNVMPIVEGTADQMSPVISPDGTQIVFENRASDTDFDLWTAGLTPSTPDQLTSDPAGYDEFAAWQPR
jgi:Tol biopolymer transport system component